MSLQQINVGTNPNDGTGDPIRTAFQKANLAISAADTALPVFNVKAAAYGALGNSNGTTGNGNNDLAAVTAAISAASVLGGVVFFPPGIYRLATPRIYINASHVVLDGPGATLCFDTQDVLEFGRVFFDGGTTTIKDVGIRNLEVFNVPGPDTSSNGAANDPLGYDPYGAPASIVTMRNCTNAFIYHCDLHNSVNWTVNIWGCSDLVISGNSVHDSEADGIHVEEGSTRVLVIGNTVYNLGDDAIAIGYSTGAVGSAVPGQNTDISVIGNNVFSTTGGVSVYGPTQGVVISNNVIDTTWNSAIKLAAAAINSSNTQIAGPISDVLIANNVIQNSGNRSKALYNRGVGGTSAIELDTFSSQGGLKRIKIIGNKVYNARCNFVITDAAGTIDTLTIENNDFDTISAVGGQGASTGGGGGNQTSNSNGDYSGIQVKVGANVKISGNTIKGSYGSAVNVYAAVGFAHVSDNLAIGCDTGGAAAPIFNIAGTGVVRSNGAYGAPSAATLSSVGTAISGDANGNYLQAAPSEAVYDSDNFTRANVTPVSGGLGSTVTKNQAWQSGQPTGIISNTAYFGGSTAYPAAFIPAGSVNMDVSITAALNGTGCRLYACMVGALPNWTSGLFFDSGTGRLYNYTSSPVQVGATTTVLTSGTHTFRLTYDDGAITLYVDGAAVITGTVSGLTGTGCGFGDAATAGAGRYSAFSVSDYSS